MMGRINPTISIAIGVVAPVKPDRLLGNEIDSRAFISEREVQLC